MNNNLLITAGSVVDAVITDGQVQTTNRTALLNYVNRVSLQMLRESQWLFLRSDVQKFITQPGAGRYWIGPDAPPSDCVDTGLKLSDVASVLSDTVFDITNNKQLFQDSYSVKNQDAFHFLDGTLRTGRPATYKYEYNDPNVVSLFPLPDNQNLYYPVPKSPLCRHIPGAFLAPRTYFVVTTFVDSLGNEGTASAQPTQITLPGLSLLEVQSPVPEISSGSQVTYNRWNVYVGLSQAGPFWKQNELPIPMGAAWVESSSGQSTTTIAPGTSIPLISPSGTLFNVTVDTDGTLLTTPVGSTSFGADFYATDASNGVHLIRVTDGGLLQTVPLTSPTFIPNPIVLLDTNNVAWQFIVLPGGLLQTQAGTGVSIPGSHPPTNTNITPIYGYVIAFRYQIERTRITNSNQLLQIPYQYLDTVIAGVNYYANLYTAKSTDLAIKTAVWKKEFQDGLAQMRRDLRINFRNTDFIGPDVTTQYQIRGQSWYYGLGG